MASVDKHHIKASFLDKPCGISEGLGRCHDLLLSHSPDRHALGIYLIIRTNKRIIRMCMTSGSSELSSVGQLHYRLAVVLVELIGHPLE